MTWVRRLLWGMLFAGVCAAPCDANQPIVRMKLESLSLRSRTGGPIGVRVKLEYNREQLLEGDLLLKIFDGARFNGLLLTTVRYEGIVLQGSDTIFNMLLPPLADASGNSFDVEAWFETATARIPLSSGTEVRDPPDTFNLFSNDFTTRCVLLCSTSGRSDPARPTRNRDALHRLLSPESLVPEEIRFGLNYFPAARGGHSLPEDPLALCSYDIVLLTDGALNQLDSAQLDALVQWTEAGGSLCVAPTDEGLAGRHLEFLSRVLPADGKRLLLTDEGTLAFVTGEPTVCAAYTGLGRSVLIPHGIDPAVDISDEEGAWIRSFLWKARGSSYPKAGESFADAHRRRHSQHSAAVQSTGRSERLRFPAGYVDPSGNWRNEDGLQPRESAFGQLCQMILMPADVQMVPTSVIVGLLVAYVLAIGPVDYCVLGWLRIRKFTWVLFPLVTLGFTLLTVAVAHHYLGSNETGGQFTVTDVVDNGRPVRSSVVRLQFVGSRRDVSTTIQSGLVSSLKSEQLNITGRFPHDYTADRKLEQWSPETIRTLTLAPQPVPDLAVDWNDIELITTQEGRQRLGRVLAGNSDVRCIQAAVMQGKTAHTVLGGVPRFNQNHEYSQRQPAIYANSFGPAGLQQARDFGSRAPLQGMFRYFSQVSPGGAAYMEDIPLLDFSNPDQWLLLILLDTEDGYHLIRKLYCVPQAAPKAHAAGEPSTADESQESPPRFESG